MKNYTVREWDTLKSISKRYYLTERWWIFLALLNFKNKPKEGERIFVPNRYSIDLGISLIIIITFWIVFLTSL